MEEKQVPIQKREECELIPEGVSCTETEDTYYIRVRQGNRKVVLRVPKNDYFGTCITIDEMVPADTKHWHGVWGTNG